MIIEHGYQVGFEAKHWGHSFDTRWDKELLRRGTTTVEEFAADESEPEDLKAAAQSIWTAVINAPLAELLPFGRRDFNHSQFRSDDNWQLQFIRDGLAVRRIPATLGLVFARNHGYVNGQFAPHDAYVWVKPEHRQQGIGSFAMEHAAQNSRHGLTVPFPVAEDNEAAQRLMRKFDIAVPSAGHA